MSVLSAAKQFIRKATPIDSTLSRLGGRRLDREYAQAVARYRSGSVDAEVHLKRLRQHWQPRRRLKEARQARIVLICMEVWEPRSLIPGILQHYDALHIPISDTSDFEFYVRQQQRIVRQFIKAETHSPADLVLIYATNAQVSAETLSAIRGHGPLVAVMCLDDRQSFQDARPQRSWPGGQLPLIGAAHLHLTNACECLRWYDFHGTSALHWPEAANPDYGRHSGITQDIDVSFVGQAYGARRSFVETLRRQGIGVSCFGRGWENPFVGDDEMFRIFARSKINLGFGYVGYSQNITCLKGRDFDIPGSGNFYLTTYDAELAECFHVGEEIACYRNEVECAEMVRYYLERPEVRARIARAGRVRVIREHTWQHRLEHLIRWAGIVEGVPQLVKPRLDDASSVVQW